MTSTVDIIEAQLESEFAPAFLDVQDESHMHNVAPGAQSHFKVVLVSSSFENKPLLARHRAVNAIIDMKKHGIHALALHTFDPQEWDQQNADTESPDCLGGTGK
jgi:BolA protein